MQVGHLLASTNQSLVAEERIGRPVGSNGCLEFGTSLYQEATRQARFGREKKRATCGGKQVAVRVRRCGRREVDQVGGRGWPSLQQRSATGTGPTTGEPSTGTRWANVKKRPDARLVRVTAANRDELPGELARLLRA